MINQETLILLVEDDLDYAELVRRAFAADHRRFQLTIANSLAEARDCIAESNPSLIIADLRLPDGLGTQLLSPGREGRTIPLVVMTGHGDEAAAVDAIKAGALDYLVKSQEVLTDLPRIAERCLREWLNIGRLQAAERAQVESDKRFRLLFENAKDAIVIFDLDGTINDLNHETELMSGFSKEELIGRQSILHLTPTSAQLVQERMQQWLSGEEIPPVIQIEGVRKDGSIAHVEGRTQFIHDLEGNIVGYQGIFRDITERWDAEVSLSRLSHENAVMAEIGRIVNSSLDIEDVFQRVGSEVGRVIPFDRLTINRINKENETVTNTYVAGIHIPELSTGQSFELEGSSNAVAVSTKAVQRIQPQDEEELTNLFPGMVTAYRAGLKSFLLVPLISQGEVVAMMRLQSCDANAYSEDDVRLGELVGSQIASAIANAHLYSEIQNLARFPSEDPNPVARVSANGIIMYANDPANTILADRGLKVGEPTSEYWQEMVEGVLADGTSKEVEIEFGTRIISVSLIPVPEAGYVNIYGRDVTDAKELDRMKDEFVSTVSHELRTPLTSIKIAAEILLNHDDDDPETRLEFLEIIDRESDRLSRLINDVLDISRLESGEMPWQLEEVDFGDVVRESVDGIQVLLTQKDLAMEVDLDSDLPLLWIDRDRLIQVVTNLLSNAIKFTPEGGKVRINAKKVDADDSDGLNEKLEVRVSDSGIGIEIADYETIFQKFKQVGDGVVNKPQGTGLGLPICKEIVEYSGGEIWVESTPGKGSCFYFTVPVSAKKYRLK